MSEKFPQKQNEVDPKIEARRNKIENDKWRKTADRAQFVGGGLDKERTDVPFIEDDKQSGGLKAGSEAYIRDVHVHTAETLGGREGEQSMTNGNQQEQKPVLQNRKERIQRSLDEERNMFQETGGQEVPIAEGVDYGHVDRIMVDVVDDLKEREAIARDDLLRVIKDINAEK